jgi:hypothetical protein
MKHLIFCFTLLFAFSLKSQTNSVHGDSIFFKGKYYSPAHYNIISEYEYSRNANSEHIDHGDSMYFKSKYYAPADYAIVKKADDKINFQTYFMPGLAYAVFQPKATDSLGQFSGLTVEYLIYAKVEQNDESGPSHFRFYSKLNILQSTKSSINSMFMYTAGIDLSLEKNPKRSFLIPYFGLEFGGLSQKQLGTTVQFTPTFGIHLLSKKNLFINVHGGYLYPIANFETLQGWFGQAGLNFALW